MVYVDFVVVMQEFGQQQVDGIDQVDQQEVYCKLKLQLYIVGDYLFVVQLFYDVVQVDVWWVLEVIGGFLLCGIVVQVGLVVIGIIG